MRELGRSGFLWRRVGRMALTAGPLLEMRRGTVSETGCAAVIKVVIAGGAAAGAGGGGVTIASAASASALVSDSTATGESSGWTAVGTSGRGSCSSSSSLSRSMMTFCVGVSTLIVIDDVVALKA